MEKLFEKATRGKMRFAHKGMLSVEELWDLSTNELDSVFKQLNSQLKRSEEESLLDTATKQDSEIRAKIEIVKHIFNTKIEEAKFREKEHEKSKKRQKIMEIMSLKQDESLQGKSEEELRTMLDEL